MPQKRKSLDILKGVAIIMILITHNRHFIMKDMSGLRQIINYCQMGCQLFFVVSGMSLCFSWFKPAQTDEKTGFGARYLRFMLRRYLRIAPGFLIMLAVNYLLNVITIDVFGHYSGFVMNREPAALLTNALFLHGFSPSCINNVFPGGWYIGTSIVLYWLFPPLVSLCALLYRRAKPLLYLLPFIFWLVNFYLERQLCSLSGQTLYPSNNSFLYFFFTNQLPCFLLGILLYFQEKDFPFQKCPAPLSAICFVLTSIISYALFVRPEIRFCYTIVPTLSGISFYWLATLFLCIEQRRAAVPKITRRVSLFLADCGRHSYGMYLTHALISWYALRELRYFLDARFPEYNDLAVFFLLLFPTTALVYLLGCGFERLTARRGKTTDMRR